MWMINMKAVLDIVSQYCPDDDGSCSKTGVDLREMLDEIEGLDETEVQPVKHGRWILCDDGYVRCSECNRKAFIENDETILTDFCHGCGADMIMDGDSE